MLVIRLLRTGRKNQPFFKIVVTDKRKPPTAGRFVEEVGILNPLKKENTLKPERIKYWLSVGAKPSPTIYNLLISEKIVEGKKIPVHKKSKKPVEVAAPVAASVPAAPVAPAPVAETPIVPVVPALEKPAEAPVTPTEEPKKEEIPKTE